MDSEVKELIRNAEDLLGKAVEEMEVDVRDAAEKAWGATLRASNALILARTGKVPERTPETTRMLHELCSKEPEIERVRLCDRYHTRSDYLHGYCFYEGRCEPVEEVKRRILETGEYIEDLKRLIGS